MSKSTGGRQFKLVLAGNGAVGKTSIRRMYLGKIFKSNYIATIGVDFAKKIIEVDDIPVDLVIWDIAGQPLYKGLRKGYYQGCSAILMVYSVDDRDSYHDVSNWISEAFDFLEKKLPPIMIIANKIDLRSANKKNEIVTTDEGEDLAIRIHETFGIQTLFIETSALTGENIDRAFEDMTSLLIEIN